MKPFQPKAIALAVFGALVFAGCNSGTSSSTGATSTTSLKHTGVITAFGSVFVNGVEYDTGSSSVTLDGVAGKDSNLKIGMVVTVEGSVNKDGVHGTATSISYADELEGTVTATNIAADGTGTLTVMGQTVTIDTATVFESKVTSITAIGDIVAGNIVEISGYSSGTGTILATRVEVKKAMLEADEEIELKGVIAGLDTTAQTFMLGALMVHYDKAKVEHTLADGLYVEVKSNTAPSADNMLIATKVEVEGDGKKGVDGKSGDGFELEGVVSSVNADKTEFVLNGQTVLVDSGTAFKNGTADGITVDAKLEVEGTLNADGKLVADEIKFRDESSIKIRANVEAIDTNAGTITVLGQTVIVNSLSMVIVKQDDEVKHDFSLSALVVGDSVDLHIAIENGKLVATKFEHDDHTATAIVELAGPVTAISGTQVTIAGITVELSALLDMTTVQVGDKLEITGEFANGVLTAKTAQKDS